MNNEQFRRLLLDNPPPTSSTNTQSKNNNDNNTAKDGARSSLSPARNEGGAARSATLGSKMRSSIPMTPRSIKPVDFARQLAEHRRESQFGGPPAAKKFKSSAAPKGTKYGEEYQDRTALRRQLESTTGNQEGGAAEKEDVAKRVEALEEMVKLGQIDHATFEKLRKEIGVGGDVGSTHLVKGLDRDLLQRVRAGEDISKPKPAEKRNEESVTGGVQGQDAVVNVDEELDRMLEETGDGEEAPRQKEKKVKKGNMAPPKLSRDEILQQLRASRAAAAKVVSPEPTLGSKFKKIKDGKGEKRRWIEQDENGRRKEILEITDENGKTKRKVRWLDKPGPQVDKHGLLMVDKTAKPLGMEVPADIVLKANAKEESEDEDMFAGVGDDYNPLGDLDEEDSSAPEDAEVETKEPDTRPSDTIATTTDGPRKPLNYFGTTATAKDDDTRSNPLLNDPTILAALKRAAAIKQDVADDDIEKQEEDVDSETLLRRKKFFEEAKRREAQDSLDIDYGFGSSRIDDEEDEEAFVDGESKRGGNKRKRGSKKRKGDKDSVSDVMRVLEGRKKEP